MVDPSKFAEIFADQQRLNELVRTIEKIESSVSKLAEKSGLLGSQTKENLKGVEDGLSGTNEALEKATEQVEKLVEKSELASNGLQKTWQHMKGLFEGLGLDKFLGDIDKVGKTMLSVQHSPETMIQGLLAGLGPIGMVLQLMLNAEKKMDEFRTAGRNALLVFQSTGSMAADQIRSQGETIGQEMQRLEAIHAASKADVIAVYSALAEGGGKAEDAVKKVGFAVEGFGDTVAGTSLALDKAFNAASGTSMNLAMQLSHSTNTALTDSIALVKDLGAASHGTGMTMQGFLGTILQVTSALRVQGSDARDLAMAFMNIEKWTKSALGTKPGEQNLHATDLATTAFQSIGQLMTGMGRGMKGLLAPVVAKSLGLTDNYEGVAGIQAMETGFVGTGADTNKVTEYTMQALYDLVKGQTHDPTQQREMLASYGASPLLAKYMVESRGQLWDNSAYSGMREKYQSQVDEAAKMEPLKKGDYDKMMEDMMKLMDAIGQGIIAILGLLLQSLVGGVSALLQALMHPGNAFAIGQAYKDAVGAKMHNLEVAGDNIVAVGATMGGDLGNMVKSLYDVSIVRKVQAAGQTAGERIVAQREEDDAHDARMAEIAVEAAEAATKGQQVLSDRANTSSVPITPAQFALRMADAEKATTTTTVQDAAGNTFQLEIQHSATVTARKVAAREPGVPAYGTPPLME